MHDDETDDDDAPDTPQLPINWDWIAAETHPSISDADPGFEIYDDQEAAALPDHPRYYHERMAARLEELVKTIRTLTEDP